VEDVRSFLDAFEAFGRHLAAVGLGTLALAIACHLVRLGARVRAWQNILRATYPGSRVAFRSVLGAYWAGVGVNAITPARGGDLVKVYRLSSLRGSCSPRGPHSTSSLSARR